MQNITSQLDAHYASGSTTLARCWYVQRMDGQIFGFTEHDQDIMFSDIYNTGNFHAGAVRYLAASSFAASAVATTAALNVDNLEVKGMLVSPAITEDDLNNRLWDYAKFTYFEVNYADLTMGRRIIRAGTLGQVQVGRANFIAELRGMTQRLQQVTGRICSPSCDANLGDARCGVNMAPFTVTGSVTGTIDSHSFVDTARTETNSTITKAINGIGTYNVVNGQYDLGNPTVIHCPGHGFSGGQQVTISGVSGLPLINGITAAIGYVDANTFTIPVDSSPWAAWTGLAWVNPAYQAPLYQVYIGGGLVTQTVPSEYFQGGLLTWTSGSNSGQAMEVKAYRPNYIYLAEAMYYAIAIGDTYTLTAGCDKIKTTCFSRFNNVINFRGFAEVPGNNSMIAGI